MAFPVEKTHTRVININVSIYTLPHRTVPFLSLTLVDHDTIYFFCKFGDKEFNVLKFPILF